MRPENKRMQAFLKANGIKAVVRYNAAGSMKHTWHLYGKEKGGVAGFQAWTPELIDKLNNLGFKDFDGGPLQRFSGNGGVFSVSVRGHFELLEDVPEAIPAKNNIILYTSRETRRNIRANRAARANDRITKRNGAPMYY